jgi:hypothetical protein
MAAGTLEAANINVNANGTFDVGGTTTVGQQMNNAGNVSINGHGVLTVQTYTQTGGSITFNDNGTLIALGTGNSIQIDGGTAGGFGTIETSCGNSFCSTAGTVVVNNGTLQVGASPDPLAIHANYAQIGGKIIFEIDPDGTGGFLESTLVFDKGADVSISDADIVLDFLNGADPTKFFGDGLLKIDTFFNVSNGDPFGVDFPLASIFTDDSFSTNLAGDSITNFDPDTGALTLAATGNVPEPDSLLLLLSGLIAAMPIAGWRSRRRRGAPFDRPRDRRRHHRGLGSSAGEEVRFAESRTG